VRAVNLIPLDQRVGASVGAGRSQGGAYAVLGLLGGCALLALLYGQARHQVSSRRSEVASLNARAQAAQAAAQELAPYTSFIAMREERVQAVAQLIDSRFDWAHAFHEIGRVLPRDASIDSLDGSVGSGTEGSSSGGSSKASGGTTGAAGVAGGAVTSATPAGSIPVITLSGCATTQAEVARTLDRLRLIDGVNEVTLQTSTQGSTSGAGKGAAVPAGQCAGPAFSIQLTFEPLPAASALGSGGAERPVSTGSAP
jgi:Tfp pilus assembly protein PilN